MLFVFYPHHQYGCPNVDHCPHLGGAALGSLVFEANGQSEWTDSLLRQIDGLREADAAKSQKIQDLERKVDELQLELKAERQKQFKAKKETAAEEAEPAANPKAKKPGAPVGHPGWFRPRPDHFDRLILVPAPCDCPFCKARVKARPDLAPYDHIQEDWIDGQYRVTCYRHEEGRCTRCRRWVRQPGPGELLRAMIGPEARAASLYLRFDIGMTCRKVTRAFAGLTNMAFTPASLLGFEKQAAELAKPLAADVAKKLRACENTHADETYWRIGGESGYGWFHGNEHLAHFRIVPTRSGKVSRAILGEDYQGNLTTDCYAGYDAHKTKSKQKCLAHVKRTAEQWYGRVPEEARASRIFFKSVERWAKSGCRWHRKWKTRSGPEKDKQASWLRKELDRLEQMPVDSQRAERLQKRLRRYHNEWLTFLTDPNVSPTNNLAEQALRSLVILRKVSFGSRTRAGAKRMGTLMTVIETAKRQGKSVLKFLGALLSLPANRAMRALYARP